jgi:co-chaperonin GroES (HSP10)
MKGDQLASGGATATFPAGKSSKDDPIKFNWTVAQDANEVPAESDESWDASAELLRQQAHDKVVSQLKPFNDRVLLRRVSEDSSKQVQIAESYVEKSDRGVILAVGDLVETTPMKVGDLVIFGKYNAENIEIDGEELVLTSSYDIRLKVG